MRGTKGVRAFHDWLRQQVAANRPWDELARAVLTAKGTTHENPAVGYYIVTVGEKRQAGDFRHGSRHLPFGPRLERHDERQPALGMVRLLKHRINIDAMPGEDAGNARAHLDLLRAFDLTDDVEPDGDTLRLDLGDMHRHSGRCGGRCARCSIVLAARGE